MGYRERHPGWGEMMYLVNFLITELGFNFVIPEP